MHTDIINSIRHVQKSFHFFLILKIKDTTAQKWLTLFTHKSTRSPFLYWWVYSSPVAIATRDAAVSSVLWQSICFMVFMHALVFVWWIARGWLWIFRWNEMGIFMSFLRTLVTLGYQSTISTVAAKSSIVHWIRLLTVRLWEKQNHSLIVIDATSDSGRNSCSMQMQYLCYVRVIYFCVASDAALVRSMSVTWVEHVRTKRLDWWQVKFRWKIHTYI